MIKSIFELQEFAQQEGSQLTIGEGGEHIVIVYYDEESYYLCSSYWIINDNGLWELHSSAKGDFRKKVVPKF